MINMIFETIDKIMPFITAVIGFVSALIVSGLSFISGFLIEKYRISKRTKEENERIYIVKRNLFQKAFLEVFNNLVKLIGLIKAIERLGENNRTKFRLRKLRNENFKKLENYDFFDDQEFAFIMEMHTISEKVDIINGFLEDSWDNINMKLLTYLRDEEAIFLVYVGKFATYLNINPKKLQIPS